MVQLNDKDLLIIKQSQGWASRSLSKLRSLTDRKYGEPLRDLIDKAVIIKEKCEDVWDDLASTDVISDNKAITEFVSMRLVFSGIKNYIENIIVPTLKKDNIDVALYYREQQEQRAQSKTQKPAKTKNQPETAEPAAQDTELNNENITQQTNEKRKKIIENIIDIIADVETIQIKGLEEAANNLLTKLKFFLEKMQENASDEDFDKMYEEVIKEYGAYKELIINKQSEASSHVYSSLIKSAKSIEESTSYYLLSLAKYGPIRTPIKSTWSNIKQYIPFAGEPSDIHSFRKETIVAAKELLKFSKDFISTIQKAISTSDSLSRWVMIIDKYNEFADLYNSKINSFASMYETYIIKNKFDKLLKKKQKSTKRDKKDNIETDHSFSDYGYLDYEISDLPSFTRNRFRQIEKIRF